MHYITIGRPSALPRGFLSCYSSNKRASLSDIQELSGNARLHPTDGDVLLLVPNPTPPPTTDEPSSMRRAAWLLNDEPARMYAPLVMRPWIMQT